ncbi:Rz1-like lysis system protein LysC [Azotobacter beijerinckii]|uniref:Rz1-like lysis system protein LysC n=1 Tax=Azotobacter beijerinckii TaxID=170623 RepID=UPI001C3157EF
MKTRNCATGLLGLCLTLPAGCSSVPPSPVPTLTVSACPLVVPCRLSPSSPRSNGDLLEALERTEAAWAECAAQVDMVYRHQPAPNNR